MNGILSAKTKYISLAIVLVCAIVLFAVPINTSIIQTKMYSVFNKVNYEGENQITGTISGYYGGYNEENTSINYLTYDNLELDYVEKDLSIGRTKDGWWVGIRFDAQGIENLTPEEYSNYKIAIGDNVYTFDDIKDGEYYFYLLDFIDKDKALTRLENTTDIYTPVNWTISINWNPIIEDDVVTNPEDATTYTIEINNLTLNQDGRVNFKVVEGRVVVQDFNIDNGTVEFFTDGTYEDDTITFSNLNLDFHTADVSIGRPVDGWWTGWKITAPSFVNANNVDDVTISLDGGLSYMPFADVMDGNYYLEVWNLINSEKIINYYENNEPIEWNFKFKWIDSNEYEEQSIKVVIDPSNITLNKDDKVFFKTVNDSIIINGSEQTNGTVDFYTDGTYENDTVTFSDLNLDFHTADPSIGRPVDGWWTGWKINAPSFIDDTNVSSATISLDNGETYMPFTDVMDGNYYLNVWNLINEDKIINYYKEGTPIEWNFKFKWIDDSDYEEQSVKVVINPDNVILNKNGRVYFKTEEGKIVIQNYEPVEGTVSFHTEGVYENSVITFSDLNLDFHTADPTIGRPVDGWWVGWRLTAPSVIDASNYENAQLSFNNGTTFYSLRDVMDGEYYVDVWNLVNYEKLVNALNGTEPLEWNCIFKWDGDSSLYNEQHIKVTVDPDNITLNKDGRVFYQTVNGEFIYIGGVPEIEFTNEEKHSYRSSKTVANYRVKRLYSNEDVDYIDIINENNNNVTLTYNEFKTLYSGFNDESITLSDGGNIVIPYTLNSTQANKVGITTSDDINIFVYGLYDNKVQFYDSESNTYEVSIDDFNQATVNTTTGLLDRTNYTYGNGYIYLIVNGYKYGYESNEKSIQYNGGGKYTFTYDYSLALPSDFDKGNLIVTHKDYDDETNDFNVYERIYTGDILEDYDSSLVTESSVSSFNVSYVIDELNHKVTYTVIYNGNSIEYSGRYTIKTVVAGKSIDVAEFEIVNGERDYFVTSSVDLDGNNNLDSTYPPSNKMYGYNIGVHMIYGTVDPSYDYLPNDLSVKIFDKMVDIEDDKYTFYDLVNYKLQIVNYKDNTIKYTIDGGDVITEELDGTSDFETKYVDAYNLLTNYVFDEDGNLDSTQDNYPSSITKYYQRGTSYYVLYNNNEVNIRDYISLGGDLNTLVNAIQRFNYDNERNVIRGLINGSYKTNIESNIVLDSDKYNNHVKNDLFNITINDTPSDINHIMNISPIGEVVSGVYYAYISYANTMEAIGYINNDANASSIDDVVIQQDLYPEYWNKNTRMTVLTYEEPEYTIGLSDPVLANASDSYDRVYANVPSTITFETTLEDIFDYSDFNISIKDSSDNDVTSNFTINYYSKNGDTYYQEPSTTLWDRQDEIDNNVNPTHYIELSYDSIDLDSYIVKISYRGVADNKTISINDNYYRQNKRNKIT